jgi:hypothetical protein
MGDEAPAAPGRVIRVTPKDTSGVFLKRRLFAVSVGDDQQALAHFMQAYPELDAVLEIVGDLCQESLRDLGLNKSGLLVPL